MKNSKLALNNSWGYISITIPFEIQSFVRKQFRSFQNQVITFIERAWYSCNYGKFGSGLLLKSGMCIAIEPMITLGTREVWMLPDKWGIITRDFKAAAHFEHTVAVRNGKAEILSSFDEIENFEQQ